MAYCKKCGAYIPIGDTACPACGYDPEEEARLARAEPFVLRVRAVRTASTCRSDSCKNPLERCVI